MGVPNFYSWLIKRYPHCLYTFDKVFFLSYHNQTHCHKVDFLYLDMNQVIYKCATNPNVLFRDYLRDRAFADVWATILNYINEIIDTVNPQQAIFLAFDGVAPRAKSNQQRQRRFASSKNDEKIQNALNDLGFQQSNLTFKNNQITPGTEFMFELNQQVRFFIEKKISDDDKFKNLKIIFSGSDVPGEGEHKILQFVRNMKLSADFDPNWTHIIYGADADLIMLGLSTHIKQFGLLREQMSYDRAKSQIAAKRIQDKVSFELINLQIVREYLEMEYSEIQNKMKMEFNIDRIIDDFLLIFFFVGNDFLPRIYCFDIKQGTVEQLIDMFKRFLCETSDYVTFNGTINWTHFTNLMILVSKFEIFALENRAHELKKELNSSQQEGNVEFREQLEKELKIIDEIRQKYQTNDQVAARSEFYKQKCQIDTNSQDGKEQINQMVKKYLQGIQFVQTYYYKGVPSWEWFYPFYYSPLCGDILLYLTQQQQVDFQFVKAQPFEPFKSLLLLLAPTNKNLLPPQFSQLLEANSALRQPFDYYPSEFEIDPFGAMWEYQFIAKIPFMDMELLEKEYNKIDKTQLCENDKNRNNFGKTYLYIFNEKNENTRIVESKLETIFKNFSVLTQEIIFDYESPQICSDLLKQFQKGQSNLPKFPSLKIIPLCNSYLRDVSTKYKKQKQLYIDVPSADLTLLNKMEKASNLKEPLPAYCGYPFQRYGELVLVMTQKSCLFFDNYTQEDIVELEFENLNMRTDELYQFLKEKVQITVNAKATSLFTISGVVVVNFYKTIHRKSDGTLYYSKKDVIQEIYPLEMISLEKKVDLKELNKHSINKEIPPGNKVICFTSKDTDKEKNGIIGKIIRKEDKDYLICGNRIPPKIDTRLFQYKETSDVKYYTIEFIAQELNSSINTILYVLGSVSILLGDKKNNLDLIAQEVDIGFNAIHQSKNMLVPELVRIHNANFDAEGYQKFQQFKNIEISEVLYQDLKSFYFQIKELFDYLNKLSFDAMRSAKIILLKHLGYNSQEEGYQKILHTYIWMLKQPTSQYYLSNVASQQANTKHIHKFEKNILKNSLLKQTKQLQQDITLIAPINWIVIIQDIFICPFFKDHPPIHKIGDRVVGMNAQTTKFGAYGTVIGLIDQGAILVEILWDEPRFGLTNLGGKCSQLSGSLVNFTDVFNLTQNWSSLIGYYRKGAQYGWDYQQKIFKPNYQDKPVGVN